MRTPPPPPIATVGGGSSSSFSCASVASSRLTSRAASTCSTATLQREDSSDSQLIPLPLWMGGVSDGRPPRVQQQRVAHHPAEAGFGTDQAGSEARRAPLHDALRCEDTGSLRSSSSAASLLRVAGLAADTTEDGDDDARSGGGPLGDGEGSGRRTHRGPAAQAQAGRPPPHRAPRLGWSASASPHSSCVAEDPALFLSRSGNSALGGTAGGGSSSASVAVASPPTVDSGAGSPSLAGSLLGNRSDTEASAPSGAPLPHADFSHADAVARGVLEAYGAGVSSGDMTAARSIAAACAELLPACCNGNFSVAAAGDRAALFFSALHVSNEGGGVVRGTP